MKYIDADKLIAEIKGLQCEQGFEDGIEERGYQFAIKDILEFITSLQQEQPEELEKKIDDWYNTMGIPVTTDALKETARHFYELGLNARKK